MVLRITEASQLKPGNNILCDGQACTVKSNEISKTGKHGHAKCRMEAVGIIDGKKRMLMAPGHERFEVPLVEKKKGQILNVKGEMASVMDLESFETLDIIIAEEIRNELKEGDQVEYWDIEGQKIIKRKA